MNRTIHFVDNGQDFLEWDIDATGLVVDCRPAQASVWNGTQVLNTVIEAGSVLDIKCNDGKLRTLAHRVIKVHVGLGHYDATVKERREAFHGRTYHYNTPNHGSHIIGVCLGLGSNIYIVAWISATGARKKIKTPRLPALTDPDSLQRTLDIWAAERKLQEVTNADA